MSLPILIKHESPVGPYWYHPDHPLCQDGQVLWELPESEETSEETCQDEVFNN
jgi:hypothetical protein